MTKQMILDIIKENKSNYSIILKNQHFELYKSVIDNFTGKTFSEKLYKYLNLDIDFKCKQCGKDTNFIGINDGYRMFCTNKCQGQSQITKDIIKQKTSEKYGVDNISKLDGIKIKKKNTFQKRYGIDCPFNITEVKEKAKKSINDKFGTGGPVTMEYVRQKSKDSIKESFVNSCLLGERLGNNVIPLFDLNGYTNIKDKTLLFKCKWCNSTFNSHLQWGIIPTCKMCDGLSKYENEVINFLKSIRDFEIIKNTFNVIPYGEIDVYLPELRIAIEFNGDYWHSVKFKNINYHLTKTKKCETLGIKLIHVNEYEWLTENKKITNIITSIINNNIDFSSFRDNLNVYCINRKFYNKSVLDLIECKILDETEPKLVKTGKFESYDCGNLIIKIV